MEEESCSSYSLKTWSSFKNMKSGKTWIKRQFFVGYFGGLLSVSHQNSNIWKYIPTIAWQAVLLSCFLFPHFFLTKSQMLCCDLMLSKYFYMMLPFFGFGDINKITHNIYSNCSDLTMIFFLYIQLIVWILTCLMFGFLLVLPCCS